MQFARLMLFPLALACAPAFARAGQAAAEAISEAIALPLPWTQGQVLRYETEQVETKVRASIRERTRTTSATEVRTITAGTDGFVQHWRGHGTRIEVLEGDSAMARAMERAAAELEDLALDDVGHGREHRGIDAAAGQGVRQGRCRRQWRTDAGRVQGLAGGLVE